MNNVILWDAPAAAAAAVAFIMHRIIDNSLQHAV